MRQETLKKNACGAQRGPTRYSPFAHTCHCTHTHIHKYTNSHRVRHRMSSVCILAKPGRPEQRTASMPTICVRSLYLAPSPLPHAPYSIWFRYVFVLVLSLFKCQLHSTFIQICVARKCLDTHTHRCTNI